MTRSNLEVKWFRYLLPVGSIALLRFCLAVLLYFSLRSDGSFYAPFMGIWKQTMPFDWLYLFSAWDTGYYYGIALQWYPAGLSPYWAFSPLYPATIRLLNLIGIDAWVGGFIISNICGILSILAFQKVAERYLPRVAALTMTLLYFLLPPVFVFSGVSYTESMFLLLSLVTWLLHTKHADLQANLVAALTALVRPYGILIIIPLAYSYLKRRQIRSIAYLTIPIGVLSAWTVYSFAFTKIWLVVRVSHVFWLTTNGMRVRAELIQLLMGNTSSIASLLPYVGIGVVALAFTLLAVFSLLRIWRIDRALFLYVCVSVLAVVYFSYFVGWRSLPRFLAFLFPIGLGLQFKRSWLFGVTITAFVVLDYFAWLAFLTDGFY